VNQHIQNIEISNFKSIKDLKIDGCKKINIFAGKPNAGKSNILEALVFYGGIESLMLVSLDDQIRFGKKNDLFFEGNLHQPSSIKVSEEKSIFLKYFENELLISNNNLDYKNPLIRFKNDGTDFYEDLSFNKKIKRYIFSTSNSEKYSFDNLENLSTPFGNNIASIISSNSELRNFVNKLLNSNNSRLLIDRLTNDIKIFKEYEDGTVFTLPYKMIADTLQRLIFYKAAIMSNKNSVLLFEEPEAHCFEPYILEFTNEVKYNENNNQFFMVTHSDFIIQEFLRDEESRNNLQIYLVNNMNGKTEVKKLDAERNDDVYEYGMNVFFNFDSLWENN
jgi:AAA15 family ATPase/GTPase